MLHDKHNALDVNKLDRDYGGCVGCGTRACHFEVLLKPRGVRQRGVRRSTGSTFDNERRDVVFLGSHAGVFLGSS